MWARLIVVVSMLACLSKCQQSFETQVETFQPRGFRVSIADASGIVDVAFHISINQYLEIQDFGEFYKEFRRPINGRWSYELPDVLVNKGDTIHYRIIVSRNRLGFAITNTYIEKKDLKDRPYNQMQPLFGYNTQPTTILETTTKKLLSEFTESVINAAKIPQPQNETTTQRESHSQLTTPLDNLPGAKKLTMSGRIPPDGEPSFTVAFILQEKLNLRPNIVSAVRHSNYSIDFTVSTVAEKLQILKAAEEKLKNSRIIIS